MRQRESHRPSFSGSRIVHFQRAATRSNVFQGDCLTLAIKCTERETESKSNLKCCLHQFLLFGDLAIYSHSFIRVTNVVTSSLTDRRLPIISCPPLYTIKSTLAGYTWSYEWRVHSFWPAANCILMLLAGLAKRTPTKKLVKIREPT